MSSESQPSGFMSGFKLDPMYVADLLDERFVAIGRFIDGAAQKGASLVRRTLPQRSDAARGVAVEQQAQRELTQRARVRLSDLHLRVGQSIYELERHKGETGETRQQLSALLEEIERLEAHLGRFDPTAHEDTADVEPSDNDGDDDDSNNLTDSVRLEEIESLLEDSVEQENQE